MSTGFELVPLAIGGTAWVVGAIAKQVKDSFSAARERADAEQVAYDQARVAFSTDMRDLALAREALEASGITVVEAEGGLDVTVDGHVARVEAGEDGALQLIAPLSMGEDAVSQLAQDLDTEYRKLVQGESYRRIVEDARNHGMTVSDEQVEDDGSITITLEV